MSIIIFKKEFLIIIFFLGFVNTGFGSPVERERLNEIKEFKLSNDLPKKTNVIEGEELIFSCIANRPIEWCTLRHGDCKIEINGIASGNFKPTKNTKKCDLENINKERARVRANFKTCNISLQNATFEDAGKWQCDLGNVDGQNLSGSTVIFVTPQTWNNNLLYYLLLIGIILLIIVLAILFCFWNKRKLCQKQNTKIESTDDNTIR